MVLICDGLFLYQGPPVSKDSEVPGGVIIKQEPADKSSKERERDRESRHKERSFFYYSDSCC